MNLPPGKQADVLVVGGDPAGATAATLLARRAGKVRDRSTTDQDAA